MTVQIGTISQLTVRDNKTTVHYNAITFFNRLLSFNTVHIN
uniref:Uncharacterized protein n=2 Tax=Anguilla anguilla TaxID=7936 RepID=A0A0E9V152_ANGAN